MISSCDISPEILCSLFDHHYVTLAFNHAILTHPRFMEIATAAAVDCYLQHADINNNPGIDINQGKVEIGVFLNTLRSINDAKFDIRLNGVTDIKQNNLLGLLAEMRMQMEDLPSADQLSLLNLTCDRDIF